MGRPYKGGDMGGPYRGRDMGRPYTGKDMGGMKLWGECVSYHGEGNIYGVRYGVCYGIAL